MKKLALIAAGWMSLVCATAHSDVIVFKTGVAKVGIIEEETPTSVKFRIKDMVLRVSRENIQTIGHAKPEENEHLKLKWAQERQQIAEERKRRREEEKKFIEEQKSEGLMEVEGKWVAPAEAEAARQEAVSKQGEAQKAIQAAQQGAFSENIDEQAGYLLDAIAQKNPFLADELRKIPELQSAMNATDISVLEKIAKFYLSITDSETELAIVEMLTEGKHEVRKYCSPLRFLYWIGKEEGMPAFHSLLKGYKPEDMFKASGSEIHELSFAELTDFLNSPKLIDAYEHLYFVYMKDEKDQAQTPEETLGRKGGDCEDYALFASYCLDKAGYKTKVLNSYWVTHRIGHSVATFEEDGLYVLDEGTGRSDREYRYKGITGPFGSYTDIGIFLANAIDGAYPKGIWAYDWKTFLEKYKKFPPHESLIEYR